jgi:hypothetical protein
MIKLTSSEIEQLIISDDTHTKQIGKLLRAHRDLKMVCEDQRRVNLGLVRQNIRLCAELKAEKIIRYSMQYSLEKSEENIARLRAQIKAK